jgi:hypothetical protein
MINITIDIAIQVENSANRMLYIHQCHDPFVIFVAIRTISQYFIAVGYPNSTQPGPLKKYPARPNPLGYPTRPWVGMGGS